MGLNYAHEFECPVRIYRQSIKEEWPVKLKHIWFLSVVGSVRVHQYVLSHLNKYYQLHRRIT